VDFATSDAKTIAITLSEGNLDGRKLLIKDGESASILELSLNTLSQAVTLADVQL
jgi:hypothetical protein